MIKRIRLYQSKSIHKTKISMQIGGTIYDFLTFTISGGK